MNKNTNKISKVNGQPIYANGRVIGTVQNGAFKKAVYSSKHFLRVPPAIALSIDSVKRAQELGADQVEIFDRDTSTTYRASIAHILENGFPIHRAGFEPQIALPLNGWVKQSKGQPLQAGLFAGMA